MNYSQISCDDSCIQSYISISKIMNKIDALKKNQENFQNVVLKKISNIIIRVTQFGPFITTSITISVTSAIIKTTRQPPPKKTDMGPDSPRRTPQSQSQYRDEWGLHFDLKKKDFKNVFTNFFNFFMQNNKIIIIFKIPIKEFNPDQMQNAINAALNFNHMPIVVATVSKIVKNNITIFIIKNNSDELISNINL